MPHSRYGRLLVPFTLAILIALSGCAGQVAKNSAPPDVTTMPAADDLIGVDDLVEASVWNLPDLGATVPVRADGRITIPLVGDVQAGGRRLEHVATDAALALAEFILDPQVTIIVAELHSHEYLSTRTKQIRDIGP